MRNRVLHAALIVPIILTLASCTWFQREKRIVLDQPFYPLSDRSISEHWVIMGNADGWSYSNGIIRSEGGRGGDWLRSRRTYSDFVLRLEYRVAPGGNSGVFIRCREDGNPWETGYECQISNEQPPRDELHCTGSLYGYVPVIQRPDESPNVWHRYEILCKGTRIMVFVNGIKTVDVDQNEMESTRNKPLSGYIGLQDSHTEAGKWVEFRNVMIREL